MILIDDRRGSKDLASHATLAPVALLTRLGAGDICFAGNGPSGPVSVGVELKSIGDLLSSSNNGRLQGSQLPGMLNTYDVSWLLYYGAYRVGSERRLEVQQRNKRWAAHSVGKREVPYGYLEGFLLSVCATGVKVKRVVTKDEAAEWIATLYAWWQKPWSKHKAVNRWDTSQDIVMPNLDADLLMRAKIAAQLPAIGQDRALKVAAHFASVWDMINSEVREWLKIDGIGPVIAKAAVRSIRQKS